MVFPHIYISCPCSDISTPVSDSYNSSDRDKGQGGEDEEEEVEEHEQATFNPRSRRANFSLYLLEHLLFCEDCHQIKCPRCTIEEIACWYCSSCLFEFPSTMVKSDGTRCTRNCFNCPVCTSPMTTNPLDAEKANIMIGPWILACGYCNWTSLDIGMRFERVTHMHAQISKMNNEGLNLLSQTESVPNPSSDPAPGSNPDTIFACLKSFYTAQISASTPTNPLFTPGGELNYNSPSTLARIMSLYTGLGSSSKKTSAKTQTMRESADQSEGLHIIDASSDRDAIRILREQGFPSTTSTAQQEGQLHPQRFTSTILPAPTLLRTKRNKRCRTCRHILVKPEAKAQSTRFRIKLVAINYIPAITVQPLSPANLTFDALPPLRPSQFLLTLKNPLFDPLRITLATPAHTPGPHQHKITILCPQFSIGANVDAWDEALGSAASDARSNRSGKAPSKAKPDLFPTRGITEGKVAEAGKVWDRGRNWTTVVVEVVCADVWSSEYEVPDPGSGLPLREKAGLEEDEDVLEIPMFVRMEWDADEGGGGGGGDGGDAIGNNIGGGGGGGGSNPGGPPTTKASVKRELAFWVVVGLGRVGGISSKAGLDR